jgi:hypothetical protein
MGAWVVVVVVVVVTLWGGERRRTGEREGYARRRVHRGLEQQKRAHGRGR